MQNITTIMRIIVGGIVVLILGALSGWYFYLHSKENTSATLDQARGLSTESPSFPSADGSTQQDQASAVSPVGAIEGSNDSSSSSLLWKVDSSPVAGMGFVTTNGTTSLYYTERANGYLFKGNVSTRTTTRLTDTLMPKMYQAVFANDGSVLERSIDTNGSITTFEGSIGTSSQSATSSDPNALVGLYLDKNIATIAINPSSRALFYLIQNSKGGVDGITENWDGSKKKTIFSSPIASWSVMYLNDNRIILYENPADGIPGYAYQLATTGSLTPLVRNIPGLTIAPLSSSKALLFGSSQNGTLTLFSQSTTTTTVSLATVADKCVWLQSVSLIAYCAVPSSIPSSNFLDDWYRGAVHTSDTWWEIDVSNGTTKQLYNPLQSDNVSLDVEEPTIDPSGTYISFINGRDQSLWVLRVAQ